MTDRGRLVAILAPPAAGTGTAALIASGRVQPARRSPRDAPAPQRAVRSISEVLDQLRDEG